MLTILTGDVIEQLRTLPNESVHCCVTSPPYWGLRDYSTNGQLGLEKTPEEYVAKMVEVFREVRRVLRKDGTLWLNLGDSYAGSWGNYGGQNRGNGTQREITAGSKAHQKSYDGLEDWKPPTATPAGLKPKDLCGIPWRVAFALQADGWWLRSDIIWAKPNPMPESVTDRPTKAHEYLFLLTKSANYFYDAEAIKEKSIWADDPRADQGHIDYDGKRDGSNGQGQRAFCSIDSSGRNKRSVWTVATAPYPEAHFATYPPDLIKPCILAGTSAKGCCAKCGSPSERIVEVERKPRGDRFGNRDGAFDRGQAGSAYQQITESETIGWQPTCRCKYEVGSKKEEPCTVLDPFAGSGTTGAVALELGRKAVLIELNPKYVELIERRCSVTMGLRLAV